MDDRALLQLLQQANQLKRTTRTGWVQRGVPDAENVAAHSYGVAFTALVLAQMVAEPLDMRKVLAMAVLHDLPEALTTDIPAPAWRYLPPGIKYDVEQAALQEILGDLPLAPDFTALWEELHAGKSREAQLVHDADRLELFLQAVNYEAQTGNRRLEEFWRVEPGFHFALSERLYLLLRKEIGR